MEASHLQQETERQIARAALANRGDDLAIVVDVRMRICNVNAAAALALDKLAIIAERQGRLLSVSQRSRTQFLQARGEGPEQCGGETRDQGQIGDVALGHRRLKLNQEHKGGPVLHKVGGDPDAD